MANSSAQVDGTNGGGSGKPPERPTTTHAAAYSHGRAYAQALAYAQARAFVSLAVKGSGLLALLFSTVVLLGGFVSSLGKVDFFCITVITAIQAAGIFKDWERSFENLGSFIHSFDPIWDEVVLVLMWNVTKRNFMLFLIIAFLSVVAAPLIWLVVGCVDVIYGLGPFACAAISYWRIAKLNHGNNRDDGTDSMADMTAALNIFYSLVIFQGTMFGVLVFARFEGDSWVASHLLAREQLSEKWGKHAIRRYISDISAKCRKDLLSIKGRDLIKYAAELLDSESQEDYLYGARLLSSFVNKGEDVSWVLLPSRHRIQRLIDSLMVSSSLDDKKEIRELAATIVANVAVHIDDLSNYPGAMRCISSLLQHQEEATQTYWNRNSKQVPDPTLQQRPIGLLTKWEHFQEKHMQKIERIRRRKLIIDQERMVDKEHQHGPKREGDTSNELIQQGLTILEKLASNSDDNRRIIFSAPGFLPKITAPLYSETFIQDVKTKAWADNVTRCLKVVYQLIRAPAGWTSRRLRHEISSDDQALSNLKSILLEVGNHEADHQEQELQLVALEILTELALDLSINLNDETRKVLVTKQLQLFLSANGDDEEESATIAGRAMVSLSTSSESNSALIMTTENGIIGRLTGILDDENITRRTIAAAIMVNLCAHGNVNNNMKEILLSKVLREIMSIKIKSQEGTISASHNNSASGDVENLGNSTNNEERHSISRVCRLLRSRLAQVLQQSPTETQEISDEERGEQEAFLSLAQVICDKLNSADLDGAIQSAVGQNNAGSEEQRREAFVDKLKMIIDDNRNPAADNLRIVKLCGQIAESVLRCEEYVEIFRNKGFKSSLSEASKTMSELENCMLFVGTDFGLKKTVRPLLSEIMKSFDQI